MRLLRAASLLICIVALSPVAVVLGALAAPETEVWDHLARYVLPGLLLNTFLLVSGVLAGVLLLALPLAWFAAVYRFPGHRWLSWALMLPLAMPAYVLAFVQVGLFDFSGPLQVALRGWFGPALRLPEVRSLPGAIVALSLCLYPYVYLMARQAFASQGRRALEVAQSLGLSPWRGFWQVALPLARPWIAAGALLVVMETLADFGAVSVFGVDTFTTAIYKAWFSMFSLPAAAQLASMLLLIAFVLMSLEQWQRRRQRFTATGRAPLQPRVLTGWRGWLVCAWGMWVLALAFFVPMLQLGLWCAAEAARDWDARYPVFLLNSLLLSGLAALLVLALALVLVYTERRSPRWAFGLPLRLSSLGYAVPGAVLAVGVFLPVAWLDQQLIALFQLERSAVLKGTLAVMLVALAIRFLNVGIGPVAAAWQRLSPSHEMAARSLGCAGLPLLARLHLPMIRGGLATGALMVFVDTIKEMPITLMTRPFGWDTLSVRVFEMTSEGEWARAALPAIAIVLAGLLPTLLLSREAARR